MDWYIEHRRKDVKDFRIRMDIILKDCGDRVADEIKPSQIDAWLKKHDWSPATKNRYKNVFGKTFKIAFADGKVYRWYDNQHTFCSRLAMRGNNLKVIQQLAGHKTIEMSARYAHLGDKSPHAAVSRL